ncbi:hypothetical protein IFM89_021995, partial [Coptis chinensis]
KSSKKIERKIQNSRVSLLIQKKILTSQNSNSLLFFIRGCFKLLNWKFWERMGDNNSANGVFKNRPVLADVSNQLGKRKFVSVSSNSSTNSGNGGEKNLVFARKEYGGVENLVKGGQRVFEFGGIGGFSVLKAKQFGGGGSLKLDSGTKSLQSRGSGEIKKCTSLVTRSSTFPYGDPAKERVLERGYELIDNKSMSVEPKAQVPEQCGDKTDSKPLSVVVGGERDEGSVSIVTQTTIGGDMVKKVATDVGGISENDLDSCDLSSVKSDDSTECYISTQGSKAGESEICTNFNADGSSITNMDMDSLKTCACSFCLKAAYIWSDIHYQDTKGRISALKKSRKAVRSVIERSRNHGEFDKNVQGSLNKPKKLEHDLMGQWRSLFLHTEDILFRESTQLEISFSVAAIKSSGVVAIEGQLQI